MGEVLEMPDDELLKIRNFGEKSLVELRDRLTERGITPQRSSSSEDSAAADGPQQPDSLGTLAVDDIGELIGGTETPLAESDDESSPVDQEEAVDEDDDPENEPDDLEDLEEDEE